MKMEVNLCTMKCVNIKSFITNYNKKTLLALVVLCFLLFYPNTLLINGFPIIDIFIKKRVVSVGILFLVLRGIIHDYYTPVWAIIFLIALILSPSLPFALIVFLTLATLIILRSLKKI